MLSKKIPLFLLLAYLATIFSPGNSSSLRPYLEPSLRQFSQAEATGTIFSVIVSAKDMATATRAVTAIRGRVTSQLWLINAVGASVTSAQLTRLAVNPALTALFANKSVGSAVDVEPTDDPTVWKVTSPVAVDVGADFAAQWQ